MIPAPKYRFLREMLHAKEQREQWRIVDVEVDGFTCCIVDKDKARHCFRIAPEIANELRSRLLNKA